tara:strand:+ start:510 stop:1370 length:861 start_codon:yes stop_codon:yes gene_type:complete
MLNFIFIIFQYVVPQHLLSQLVGKLAATKNFKLKNYFISYFLKNYDINMAEAELENAFDFKTFNHFFTRKLKNDVRPICSENNVIISPADGVVSQVGIIKNGEVFQAKGKSFNLYDFLGRNKNISDNFLNGSFSTIYLSPKDYHRIHMPFAGTLRSMDYIPGNLFSVNPVTVENVNNLFARNERLSCIFDTNNGPMAVVLVGAMIVAGIRVKWRKNPFIKNKKIQHFKYPLKGDGSVHLKKGDELGRFLLGSTVVILFPNKKINWNKNIKVETSLKMGQSIAQTSS